MKKDTFMDCKDIQKILAEAEDPSQALAPEIQLHIDNCHKCRVLRSQLLELHRLARQQEPPEIPTGFELELYRRLNNSEKERLLDSAPSEHLPDAFQSRNRKKKLWIAMAMAAMLAITIGAWLVFYRLPERQKTPTTYHRLQLAILSHQEYPDVFIDIHLPAQVRLLPEMGKSLGQGAHLRFQSHVKPGINEISLPLLAFGKPGEVRARLTVGKYRWDAKVKLSSGKKAASALKTEKGGLQFAWLFRVESRNGESL